MLYARYLRSWNSGGATKCRRWKHLRKLSEDVSSIVRYWHPLGCRAIELAKPPQEDVI